jgi:hypothetical protein
MKKPTPKAPDSRDILTIRADDMRDNWRFAGKALAILLEHFPARVSHVGRETCGFEGDETLIQIDAVLDQRTVDADGKAHIVVFGALRDVLTTAHGATIQFPGACADFPLTFTEADGDFWVDVGDERSRQAFPSHLQKAIPARYGNGKTPYISKTAFWNAFRLAVRLLAALDGGEKLSDELVVRVQDELEKRPPDRWHRHPATVRTMTEIALRIPDGIPIRRIRPTARCGIAACEARREDGVAVEWGVEEDEGGRLRIGYLLAKDGDMEERSVGLIFSNDPWRFSYRTAAEDAADSRHLRRLLRRLSKIERLAAKNPTLRTIKQAAIDAFMDFLR